MAELSNKKDYLTTTEAAKVLSVSPDTVLKWVKAGKLKSYRTFGGHYRIPQSALDIYQTGGTQLRTEAAVAEPAAFEYCWEFLAHGGEIKKECLDCITYKSRSKRCYELRDLPEGLGCLRVYCKSTCEECRYFQMVSEQELNIIILGKKNKLLDDPARLKNLPGYKIEFVDSEYACASMIENFRPDYIVIDCSFGKRRTSNMCTNIFNDTRIPVPRIILASRSQKLTEYCDKEVFGWITKPFSVEQLRNCLFGANRIENN